jgi:hypothetical protein
MDVSGYIRALARIRALSAAGHWAEAPGAATGKTASAAI